MPLWAANMQKLFGESLGFKITAQMRLKWKQSDFMNISHTAELQHRLVSHTPQLRFHRPI